MPLPGLSIRIAAERPPARLRKTTKGHITAGVHEFGTAIPVAQLGSGEAGELAQDTCPSDVREGLAGIG